MSKLPSTRSLSVQLLAGVLLSLFIAMLAFGLFYALGNALLDHTVYGESFSEKWPTDSFSSCRAMWKKKA